MSKRKKRLLTQKRQNIFAGCPLTLGEGYDKIELFKIEIFKIGGYAVKKEKRGAEKENKAALNAKNAALNEDKTGVVTENSIVKTDKAVSETEKVAGSAGKKVHNAEGTAKRVKSTALEAEKAADKASGGAVAEISDNAGAAKKNAGGAGKNGGAKQDVEEETGGADAEEKRTRITAAHVFGGTKKFMDAYGRAMFPLCEETGLPMPAIDMLLFLANNPEHDTAKDICKLRGFKPAIVSFHVDKMVEEGYLERKTDEHDRRKFCLAYTDKATDIIERGREIQLLFAKKMLDGISDEDAKTMKRCFDTFSKNLEDILENGLGGESEK